MGLLGSALSLAARLMIALIIVAIAIALGVAYQPLLFLLPLVAPVVFGFSCPVPEVRWHFPAASRRDAASSDE